MQAQVREQGSVRPREPGRSFAEYRGSRFSEVWGAVASDPYEHLPQHVITLRELLHPQALMQIYRASRRTLHTRHDLLPAFDKPVHPFGICLRGRWRITAPNPYTGYFRQGSEGLVIARASDNMGEYRPGRLRFLALAGKLYPTRDPEHRELLETANFVMNENLIGSHTKHFVDANLATDLLPFHPLLDLRLKWPAGLLIAATFSLADRATSITQGLRRQLFPIAQLGQPKSAPWYAPRVMRLVSDPRNRRIDTPELRQELALQRHPYGIRYFIEVAEHRSYLIPRHFQRIGDILFTASVTSYSGDHRLHFHHPRFDHDWSAEQ